RRVLVGDDGAAAVDGLGERIHDAADYRIPDGHFHDASGALDLIAFTDGGVFAEQHDADLAFFQVQGEASDVVREFEQLAGHDLFQSVDPGDAVSDRNHRTHFAHVNAGSVFFDLLADDLADFVCFDVHK